MVTMTTTADTDQTTTKLPPPSCSHGFPTPLELPADPFQPTTRMGGAQVRTEAHERTWRTIPYHHKILTPARILIMTCA